MTRLISGIALLALACSATAAPTSYVFDSVSKFDLHVSQPSITGILQGTASPVTVTWMDDSSGDYRYAVSRCIPVFLTMMEKPGRYLLNLTVDPAQSHVGMVSCGLELRN